jgi:hypothetical protein
MMRWDVPWFRTTVPGHLQQVAAEILEASLSELPSPIDLHVFSDYRFDLFSTLKCIRAALIDHSIAVAQDWKPYCAEPHKSIGLLLGKEITKL